MLISSFKLVFSCIWKVAKLNKSWFLSIISQTHCCTQVLGVFESTGLFQILKAKQKLTVGISTPSKDPLQHSMPLEWTEYVV